MAERIRRDGLASIIKYEGDRDTLIWKHPIEDFNLGSQLIVHESQEAIFFKDGQALDLFGPGRYTLETQQLPLLEKLYQLPTDTEGTFHSEVYFINKTVQMALKWGTPEKVRFIDPLTGVPLELGASGEMNLQVADSRKLLVKLVGTGKGIPWGNGGVGSLQAMFRPLIANAVKANLASVIKAEAIDLLEIDEKLDVLSATLKEKLLPGFEEYGLTVPQFYVNRIVLPEDLAWLENGERREAAVGSIPADIASLDIGSKTAENYRRLIESSATVFVNGPVHFRSVDPEKFEYKISGPIGRDTAEVLAELGYTEDQIKAMYEAQEVK